MSAFAPRLARVKLRDGASLLVVMACALMSMSCTTFSKKNPVKVTEIAPQVFIAQGERGEPNVENGARIGNVGFIVGPSGVLVINAGVSAAHARALMTQIRTITDQPIKLVVITQAVQEYLMGAATFQEQGVPVITHSESAILIKARCNTCLQNLNRMLGEPVMRGTRVLVPDRTISVSTTINEIGRPIELLATGWGATPGDLSVWDASAGVLFAGALVTGERVPDLRDGRVTGWLRALDAIERASVRVVAPGYGRIGTKRDIRATRDYLAQSLAGVKEAFDAGTSLLNIGAQVPMKSVSQWDRYKDLHAQNLHHLYLHVEREAFNTAPPVERGPDD